MVSKKELEDRIASLEYRLRALKKRQEVREEYFDKRISTLIEKYVREHIYYTTTANTRAFEQGGKIRTVVRGAKEILEELGE